MIPTQSIATAASSAQHPTGVQDSKSAPVASLAAKVSDATKAAPKALVQNTPKVQYASIVGKKDEVNTKSAAAAAPTKASTPPSQAKSQTGLQSVGEIKSLKNIKNAHQDDIHGMILAGPSTFVTGSKDGALKLWNHEELVRDVWIPEGIDYKEWITALSPLGADRWISGTRNGFVDLWENSGERIASLEVNPPNSGSHKCKDRNASRVNCIAQDTFSQGVFYIGRPTQFTVHELTEDDSATYVTTINSCKTSENDWVYCVTPLAKKKVLVVTGARFDIFEVANKGWKKTALINEAYSKDTPRHQRPFISCVTGLQNQPGIYGLAVFGGPVRIMNVETQKQVRSYHEHKKRVWTVENIREQVIASCSDDHTIKIWDLRLAKSAITLSNNIGRVSTLLRLSDHSLVSGACPDDLKTAHEKARLTYWDIRKL